MLTLIQLFLKCMFLKFGIFFCSFGDGMQYPVQMKHFPGNIGNTSNYESMGNSCSLDKIGTSQNNETHELTKNLLNQSAGHMEDKSTTANESIKTDNKSLAVETSISMS